MLSNMCSLALEETKTETAAEVSELGAMPVERLEREITQQAAHINAATCRWLLLVGEFDRREGWAAWDCRSCTHWLSYRCGLSPAAAREQLRVARLLDGLPEIRRTFGRGELCYSQVRALTRVATAETEGQLLMIARHASAAQLERIVRGFRSVVGYELGRPEHESRYVRCGRDDDGSLLLRARLPAEEGALVLAALVVLMTTFAPWIRLHYHVPRRIDPPVKMPIELLPWVDSVALGIFAAIAPAARPIRMTNSISRMTSWISPA